MPLPAFGPRRRIVHLVVCALLTMTAASASAQGVPGRNVSLVGPTPRPASCASAPFCGGKLPDTGLKQQNEPSCAMSPETGAIFCGANDYRGVDRTDGTLGDAWLGAMMSRAGDTWVSRLIPGFKGDVPSLGFGFGADPIVNAFPGGMGYVFIAGNRGDNGTGGVFFQRWVEAGKEDGYPFVPANEPTRQISSGTAGRFLDKPAAMINLVGTGTCTIPYVKSDGTPGSRTVPKFEVAVAYAIFLGSSQSDGTAIYVLKSSDCGVTWDNPGTKITQTISVNQGVSLVANGSSYLAVWRRFGDTNEAPALLYQYSGNRGKSWLNKAALIATIAPFDQPTGNTTFRTNALPAAAADGTAFHVFWAERDATSGLSRIRYSSTATGTKWTAAQYVDNFDGLTGYQFMPGATSAQGIVQVAWYDTRDDFTRFSDPTSPYINDWRDPNGIVRRHTADIRAAQATWNGTSLVFSKPSQTAPTTSIKVSRYLTGIAPFGPAHAQIQLEHSFLNSRIFAQGTKPFVGDYIAVAARAFKLDSTNQWVANTAATPDKPSFFVAWADNRMIRGNTIADFVQPTGYTPPTFSSLSDGVVDPSATYPTCDPASPNPLSNTRNQDVFGTTIRPGLIVSVPSTTKPTGSIQRTYVVWLRNATTTAKTYRLSIASQPADAPATGRASWDQLPFVPPFSTAPRLDEYAAIPGRSGAVRTAFVVSSLTSAPAIKVLVTEVSATTHVPVPGGDTASVSLNAQNPDIENADFLNPDIENFSILFTEIHNPDIENKTFGSISNPDIENSDLTAFPIAFPDIENPDIENPDIENPDIENSSLFSIAYPDIENPDIENPDIENSALTEVTWAVKNSGNTTSGQEAKPLLPSSLPYKTQLIVRRVFHTPTSQQCALVSQPVNQILAQTEAQPGVTPTASYAAEPGETVLVTLRISGTTSFNPNGVGLVVKAQARNTGLELTPDVDPTLCDTSDPTSFCSADVPVDVTAPVLALSPNLTVSAAPDSAVVTYTASATDDVDGTVAVQCAPASGSVFPLGTTTVTCSATDTAGNTATGSFTVTVKDTTAPVFGSTPNVTASATSSAGATVTYSVSATDAVSGAVVPACTPASGSTFPLGNTTVTCTATDTAGNVASASFTVAVVDTTAPVFTATPPDLLAEATGPAGAPVTYSTPPATDVVGIASVTCTPGSGTTFPLGTSPVTCVAKDTSGNSATTGFSVTVRDTTPPAIAPHADVQATASASGTFLLVYTAPAASDLVDGTVPVICSPASGSIVQPGTTVVTCSASDKRGNVSQSTFNAIAQYGFTGLSVPAVANQGSVVPLVWGYTSPSGAIDTSAMTPVVRIRPLSSCVNGTETGVTFDDWKNPGNSDFTYNSSNNTWKFNWQTTTFAAGCYNLYVRLYNGQTFVQQNGPASIRLK